MSEEIFEVLLNNTISSDSLCHWLTSIPNSEGYKLVDGLTVSKQEFIPYFLNEIHQRTKWVLKESNEIKTPLKANPNNPKSPRSNTPKNNLSVESSENVNSTEKRCRSKVKLFTSPRREGDSTIFKASTPNVLAPSSPIFTPNKSTSLIDSPIWISSPDAPTTPVSGNKFKSWNSGNEFFENTKPKNKSFDEDGRFRSRSKLMLGDFIKESGTVKSKARRIKPTKVSSEAVRALPFDGPFTNPAFHSPEIKTQTSVDDRSSLKMECDLVKNKLNELNLSEISNASSSTPVSPLLEHSLSLESCKSIDQDVMATPTKSTKKPLLDQSLVTNMETLDLLASIFACLLSSNLCENIMVELCYLINLTTTDNIKDGAIKVQPFNSIHNCCYFAVNTLQKIENILTLLASTTLSLMAAIPAISIFVPSFQKRLEDISRLKLQKSSSNIPVPQDGNVSFQYDTDNVENFTSSFNFSTFRKQRDGLYLLLSTWEKNHNSQQWDFQAKLGGKVKSLLVLAEDPTNLMHLARLFRNQLLASCSIQCPALDKAEEEVLELLPTADRGRLSLLQARLSRPDTRRGPVPSPTFQGRQVFFQEFIRACGPGMFLHFLQLSLVDELLRINEMEFTLDGNDNFVDELSQKRFLDCVSSAHIYAKFLAYAEFLPYQSKDVISEQVLNLHNETRQRILPLFNIEECLIDALRSHRLVITIPWLVAYLSLMDKGSAKLPAYRGVWQYLQTLRQNIPSHVTPEARFLIQLCLGWLFQVAAVPDIDGHKIIPSCDERGLDELSIVTEPVLYYICPFLCELNAVLSGNSTTTGRHIRPTPTTPKEDKTLAAKQLELRLEDNFLQNQSQSTKRTILFVCERVASCAIKQIAAEVLPKIKMDIIEKYYDLLRNKKVTIRQVILEWEQAVTLSSKVSADATVRLRVQQSMRALLGRDLAEAAVDTAIDLTIRQALEKVHSWIQSFAVAGSVKKDVITCLEDKEKVSDDVNPGVVNESEFDPVNTLPVGVEQLRQALMQALVGQLTPELLTNAIQITRMSILDRPLPVPTERILFCMFAELLTWAYVFCGNLEFLCQDLAFNFKTIFRNEHLSSPLNRLFCARNLELCKNQFALLRLIKLPILLVDAGLISHEDASSQVSEFLKISPETFRNYLNETLEYVNKNT